MASQTVKLSYQHGTKLKTWKDKVADTEDLVQKVYDTLYEVLQTQWY